MVTKLFLDTNIILDLLDDKRTFHFESFELYKLMEKGLVLGFISESVITNTDYILKKLMTKSNRIQLLDELLHLIKILPCSNLVFERAIKNNFDDLEDVILYQIALESRLNYFVTNDINATKKLSSPLLPVIAPKNVIKFVSNK